MAEIIVRVHHHWKDNEESLVKRIARVVCHDDSMCEQQKMGYKWGLNTSGNDWWASGIEKNDKHYFIKVAYRYGHGGRNAAMMEALKIFLEWELGPLE